MVRRWDWRLNAGAKVYGAAGVEAYLLIDGTLSTEDFRSERFFGRPQAAEPNFDSTEDEAPNARARNRRENLDRPGIWLAIRAAENKVPAGRLVFPGLNKQRPDFGPEEGEEEERPRLDPTDDDDDDDELLLLLLLDSASSCILLILPNSFAIISFSLDNSRCTLFIVVTLSLYLPSFVWASSCSF